MMKFNIKKHAMKNAVTMAMVGILGIGIYMVWSKYSQGQTEGGGAGASHAVEVVVQTIKTESIDLFQDLPGRTQAFKVAEIRPQVSGIIIKRLFEEGSDVKEGQQLYQIDPAPYKAAYDSALADLQKAEANNKSTQAKQARYAELVKIGGVSKQEYDDTAAALAQSRAEVAIAKAAVTSAKINLDYTKVFSPISGRIGKSSVTEGALVTANQAAALAVVQQLDRIHIDVMQSVSSLRKMRHSFGKDSKQLSATLTIEGENKPYNQKGILEFADVTVDQGTGMVQLRILFENPEIDLLPGMFVKVRVTQNQANTILIPQKAVTRNADGSTTVWRVDSKNTVQIQPVSLMRAIDNHWLVASGLDPGDRIVVEGLPKLKPGALVNPLGQSDAPQIPAEKE